MSLPNSTTTITVLRAPAADQYAEPYTTQGTNGYDSVVSGVRAVIDRPTGRERPGGGEQTLTDVEMACDPCDLRRTDSVRDDSTGAIYRVAWLHRIIGGPLEHIHAGLNIAEGLI